MPRTRSVDDYLALIDLKHRYCHHIDHGNYDDWANLFTEDGAFHRSPTEVYHGHDELLTFASEVFDDEYDYSAHFVTNPIITVDGDEATGQWYLYLPLVKSDGTVGWLQADYDDTYRRIDDQWLIETVHITPNASRSVDHAQF